jgi:hypothetical protein
VDGISVEAVVGNISGLGPAVSKALSGLSEQLAQEVNRLETVREAVAAASLTCVPIARGAGARLRPGTGSAGTAGQRSTPAPRRDRCRPA